MTDKTQRDTLYEIMKQAQVFASAWSLVGGKLDFGNALEDAETAKEELRDMVAAALTQPQAQQAKTGHDSDCSLHNEPAYPAGPCDCSQQAAAVPAGFIDLFKVASEWTKQHPEKEIGDIADLLGALTGHINAMLSSAPAAPQAQG